MISEISMWCVLIVAISFCPSSGSPTASQNDDSLGPQPVVYIETRAKLDELSNEPTPKCLSKMSEQQAETRMIGDTYRWNNGIDFLLDSKFSQAEVTLINNAIYQIKTVVCIRVGIWQNASTATGDYVFIQKGAVYSGCWSYVGKQGGKQELNLEPACVHTGTVLHEIIHALGFNHEQCRMDRDTYVKVHYQNIIPAYAFAYDKIDTPTFGVPYDYRSIMHYNQLDFSSNGRVTISAKNRTPVGSLYVITASDKLKIKKMYNCAV